MADNDEYEPVVDAAFEQAAAGEGLAGESEFSQLLAAAREKSLRLQAELENVRRRAQREIIDERRYAALPILRDLLPVLDNVTRAVEAAEKNGGATGLLEGVKLIGQQLEGVLAANFCQKINAQGEPFDPNLHQAICQQPSPDHAPGTVLTVVQAGYQLHDRVVRPAQVIVSSL